MSATRSTAVLALTLASLSGFALSACGSEGTDQARDTTPVAEEGAGETTGAGETGDDAPAAPAEPCPAALVDAPESGAATKPAPSAPDLPAPDAAWVCTYTAGSGADAGWNLQGEPAELDDAALADVAAGLGELEPADLAARMCTMELGPRWLVVTESAGQRAGVVVDDFGCHDVRLTDDPYETAPGAAGSDPAAGTVPGVLEAPMSFVNAVEAAAPAS